MSETVYFEVEGYGRWNSRAIRYLFETLKVPKQDYFTTEDLAADIKQRWAIQPPKPEPLELDEDNPDDLEKVATFLGYVDGGGIEPAYSAIAEVQDFLNGAAARLREKQIEVDQASDDRQRAEDYAGEFRARGTTAWQDSVDDYLAGLKAAREEAK